MVSTTLILAKACDAVKQYKIKASIYTVRIPKQALQDTRFLEIDEPIVQIWLAVTSFFQS